MRKKEAGGFLGFYFARRGAFLALWALPLLIARAFSSAPVDWSGLAPLAAAALLRLWAGRHIGSHTNGSKPGAGVALAFSGPYAFSRNPLYLSNILAAAGVGLFANCLPWPGLAALLAGIFAHHAAVVQAEEVWLRTHLPDAYSAYAARVPRWLGWSFPWRALLSPAPVPRGAAWSAQAANCAKPFALLPPLWLLANW